MNAPKQKGTRWESLIVGYLRELGWANAERRSLNGTKDRGDITGISGVVIEAKNQNRHSLAEWVDEAETERVNDGATVAAVWMHRKGKGQPQDAYVVMTGAQFAYLLRKAGY